MHHCPTSIADGGGIGADSSRNGSFCPTGEHFLQKDLPYQSGSLPPPSKPVAEPEGLAFQSAPHVVHHRRLLPDGERLVALHGLSHSSVRLASNSSSTGRAPPRCSLPCQLLRVFDALEVRLRKREQRVHLVLREALHVAGDNLQAAGGQQRAGLFDAALLEAGDRRASSLLLGMKEWASQQTRT